MGLHDGPLVFIYYLCKILVFWSLFKYMYGMWGHESSSFMWLISSNTTPYSDNIESRTIKIVCYLFKRQIIRTLPLSSDNIYSALWPDVATMNILNTADIFCLLASFIIIHRNASMLLFGTERVNVHGQHSMSMHSDRSRALESTHVGQSRLPADMPAVWRRPPQVVGFCVRKLNWMFLMCWRRRCREINCSACYYLLCMFERVCVRAPQTKEPATRTGVRVRVSNNRTYWIQVFNYFSLWIPRRVGVFPIRLNNVIEPTLNRWTWQSRLQ